MRIDWRYVEQEVRPHACAAVTVAFMGLALGLLAFLLQAASWGHHIIRNGRSAIANILSVSQRRTPFGLAYRIDYRFRNAEGKELFGSCMTVEMPTTIGDDRVVVFYDAYGASVVAGTEPPLLPPWILPILAMPVSFGFVVAGRERFRVIESVLRRGERLRAEIVGMKKVWWRMVWLEPPMRIRVRFKAGRGMRYASVVTYMWRRIEGRQYVTLLRRGRIVTIYELFAEGRDETA